MIKLIIIGCGQVVSSTHLPNLMVLKDEVQVMGISDIDIENAQLLAAQYGIPYVNADYRELVNQIQPDAALIAVPNRFHAETSINLLNMGVNVFCEKPPAINGNDARRMEQAAIDSGKLLTYGFHFRHSKDVSYINQLIRSGEFGRIYHLNLKWLRRRGIPGWGNFTNKNLQGGGPLIDIGIHLLDLGLNFLDFAIPTIVLASKSDLIGRKGGRGSMGDWQGKDFSVEDGLFALIRFENNSSIALSTSFAINAELANDRQINIYGENLGAELFPLKLFGECNSRQINSIVNSNEDEELHLKSIRNFIRAVEGREPLLVSANQGTRLQLLVDAIYKSAENGEAVNF